MITLPTGTVTFLFTDLEGQTPLWEQRPEAMRAAVAGHGGQVLLSQVTAGLVRGALPAGAELRDLGEHRLRDLQEPERLFQLVAPALPDRFPPPRTPGARPNNLPLQLTSFVGREREVIEVRRLLGAT